MVITSRGIFIIFIINKNVASIIQSSYYLTIR